MNEKTVTFVGKTWGECRFQWGQFCDKLPREPFVVGTDAHRIAGLYEITFRYLPECPEEDDEPDEPVWRDDAGYTESERQDISDAGRGHLLR